MSESEISVFDRLVGARPPAQPQILFDTACVLGGSMAGLFAARVLSDYARHVVILDRDDLTGAATSRPGTPQDQQVHTLLPGGGQWIERWLPGFTEDARRSGAIVAPPKTALTAFDGHRQAISGADNHDFLIASRPFLESRVRARVTALPNVTLRRARATGLRFGAEAVNAVRYLGDDAEAVLPVDFVVDATGRASRLTDWVDEAGYDKPPMVRLEAPINYATALFDRTTPAEELEVAAALAISSAEHPVNGVSVASTNAIEGDRWIVMLMGYDDNRPGRTIEEMRAYCADLPAVFSEATRGAVVRDVAVYHQQESRRRDFAELAHFPARLVSVGDAVASFNPVYGQGMSSAALHASCLSEFLGSGPDLDTKAVDFFRAQRVVVDAAWMISAGGDAARRDQIEGTFVPEQVRQQRAALHRINAASTVDSEVARAFNNVAYMLRHPLTLGDPALVERTMAAR